MLCMFSVIRPSKLNVVISDSVPCLVHTQLCKGLAEFGYEYYHLTTDEFLFCVREFCILCVNYIILLHVIDETQGLGCILNLLIVYYL
jgi:hypothetical protein